MRRRRDPRVPVALDLGDRSAGARWSNNTMRRGKNGRGPVPPGRRGETRPARRRRGRTPPSRVCAANRPRGDRSVVGRFPETGPDRGSQDCRAWVGHLAGSIRRRRLELHRRQRGSRWRDRWFR
jgi:hypothetical protein